MRLSKSEIQKQIEDLVNVASAPQTLEALKQLADAPEGRRSAVAEEFTSPKALAAKGVEIPDGMRVSLRTFEAATDKTLSWYTYDSATGREMIHDPDALPLGTTICASVGFFVCVSVGREFGDNDEQQ